MEKQITVIHFVHTLYGGVASVAANLMNYQNSIGYKTLVAYVVDSDSFQELLDFSCEKIKVPQNRIPGFSMAFGMRIREVVSSYQQTYKEELVIVHAHNVQALGALANWCKYPLVCTLHSLNGDEKSIRKVLSNQLYQLAITRLIKHRKEITSVSKAIVEAYVPATYSDQVKVIRNCAQIDADLKVDNGDSFVIGHVGNLSYAKGWDTIWEAYCLLPPEYREHIRFYSAGNEADFTREWIKEHSEQLQLGDGVVYNGYVNDAKSEFIPKLDLLVLASRNEGLGLVQVEAMGYGIPVLGRDTGGICEVLKDGFNGYVINSPQDLADRIVMLFSDRREYCRLSCNARNTYLSGFTFEHMTQEYGEIYNRILGGE